MEETEETLECLSCRKRGKHKDIVDWDMRSVRPIRCKHCGARGDYLKLVFKVVKEA